MVIASAMSHAPKRHFIVYFLANVVEQRKLSRFSVRNRMSITSGGPSPVNIKVSDGRCRWEGYLDLGFVLASATGAALVFRVSVFRGLNSKSPAPTGEVGPVACSTAPSALGVIMNGRFPNQLVP